MFDEVGLLELDMFEVSGTGFGTDFDGDELVQKPRGELSFVFEGCNSAVASWSPESGSVELDTDTLEYKLQRIALGLEGVKCSQSFNQASSPWIITDDYDIPLAQGAREKLRTEYFELGQWNIITAFTKETFEEWRYNNQVDGPGTYVIDAHKAGIGDFNGDSAQDMMINWATFPHTLPRPPISPSILINQGGELRLSSSIWQEAPPARMFSYKVGVADFNHDATDDVVLGSFGIIERLPDDEFNFIHERIPLMISENGKLADYSDRIEGQETSVLPTFSFAHDLAVGDLNGDGHIDFYQGRHIFTGDGTGRFSVSQEPPAEDGRGGDVYAMSSAIGDLDGDGIGDLVIGLADGQSPDTVISGWIFLSNGETDLANSKRVVLPKGRYGLLNTKHNSITIADVTGDGREDILIGQTQAEPYYEGRQLQLLANKGDGVFVDETELRLAQGIRPEAQGEGITFVMDVNGDGYTDIVDASGGRPSDNAILINNGEGFYERLPTEELVIVQNYHLRGFENWEGFDYGKARTMYIYPIDLNGDGLASFVIQMDPPQEVSPGDGEYNLSSVYVINPIKPYKPVSKSK
ncbi:MAG: VCBS repeat-containing protein [Wenzhouxiangella sp.]|nr:VCBS repeat-containing protein [Wenzhouxiangella sp.]